ncbi:GntR family transcriptional regulator [Superficieibacter electus]|uniref:GntR family transcriptional regulator n=1 Tax=Superficieibacter electus TaxID=2022662 RepID=A0A2P5GM62_9ENTR|nr:GntR family transcriptional regulator [Superficieibacter electus]MDU4436197.1 GntR family transcriptional regulator [Pluralibacter gergoviae]POP43076.1 GntR family transcriptional regulator [Superficieibacter electus]POP46571.1 GntR family transcriptional regulator [Superficieibacter electus]
MRLYQEIGQQLRNAIQQGAYRAGDKLPAERDLAAQFSVSRSVVREALILLELEQCVEIRKGSGVYVLPPASVVPVVEPASDSVTCGVFELLQARQLLESEIAGFAALQATRNDIVELRKAVELERQQLSSGTIADDTDEHFHYLVAMATQNAALVAIVQESWKLRQRSGMWLNHHQDTSDFSARWAWFEDRMQILQAIQHRDAVAAKRAMWQHLENVKNKMLTQADISAADFDGYLFTSTPIDNNTTK